jgi:hypothetical protein
MAHWPDVGLRGTPFIPCVPEFTPFVPEFTPDVTEFTPRVPEFTPLVSFNSPPVSFNSPPVSFNSPPCVPEFTPCVWPIRSLPSPLPQVFRWPLPALLSKLASIVTSALWGLSLGESAGAHSRFWGWEPSLLCVLEIRTRTSHANRTPRINDRDNYGHNDNQRRVGSGHHRDEF